MGICREKDIGVYFGIFCQGKVYPGRRGRECELWFGLGKMEIRKA